MVLLVRVQHLLPSTRERHGRGITSRDAPAPGGRRVTTYEVGPPLVEEGGPPGPTHETTTRGDLGGVSLVVELR